MWRCVWSKINLVQNYPCALPWIAYEFIFSFIVQILFFKKPYLLTKHDRQLSPAIDWWIELHFFSLYNKIFAWAGYLITEIGLVWRTHVETFHRSTEPIYLFSNTESRIRWSIETRVSEQLKSIWQLNARHAALGILFHCIALHCITLLTIQWRAKFHVNVIRQCWIFFFSYIFFPNYRTSFSIISWQISFYFLF